MQLENIVGTLEKAFSDVDPATIQHASEIMNERRTNNELKRGFWTADFPMYKVEGDEAVLYLASREHNLIFKNPDKAIKQIRETNNYRPEQKDIDSVVKSDKTLRIELSKLKLEKDNNEWCHFNIDTKDYRKLNKSQRTLAERVYGQGNVNFSKNMKMLNTENIKKTAIYVLNPQYVKENAKEGAISRVSWLSGFDYNSNFSAEVRYVDDILGCLRGVRKKVAEGSAQNIITPTPEQTLKAVDISEVLKKACRTDDYAPSQVKLLRNILEQEGYQIIKKS